ncbi:MAG: hypothetical protein LBM98_12795 [Oscillospiraceae bacterium]|jgi:hypothetical protein|nr:hypothetical protein [Oscillospiraceae bacterium]
MTYKDAIVYAYNKTPWYLRNKNIDPARKFFCLNPEHVDRKGSMYYDEKVCSCICEDCGAKYTIFDLIGFDFGLRGVEKQRQRAFWLFDIKVDYKAHDTIVRTDYVTPIPLPVVTPPGAAEPAPEPIEPTPITDNMAEVRVAMSWEQFGKLSAVAREAEATPEEYITRLLREKLGF